MWKSLSIKTQLILILLIPISGLLYMAVSNIKTSFEKYRSIKNGLVHIENLAGLSQGMSEISVERGYYIFSSFDHTKNARFIEEKKKTVDWFNNSKFNDNVITKNIETLYSQLNELRVEIKNKKITNEVAYLKYTNLNNTLKNLIEREIILTEDPKLSTLARNYYNYVLLKEAALLKRCLCLLKIKKEENNQTVDDLVLELFSKGQTLEDNVFFNLKNIKTESSNSDLESFLNSNSVKAFHTDSDLIIHGNLIKTADQWWNQSTKVTDRINVLKKQNLDYVIKYTYDEKDSALKSIIISTSLLLIFLILAIVIIISLISKLSSSLIAISTSIKKISAGEMTEDKKFVLSSEFNQINQSFNQLLKASKQQVELAKEIGSGNYGSTIPIRSKNDILNMSLNNMSTDLQRLHLEIYETSWLEKGLIDINNSIAASKKLNNFGTNLCEVLAKQTRGCQANFYIKNTENENELKRIGGYAYDKNSPDVINFGEGLLGEAARGNEQLCMNNLLKSYSQITSSLGKTELYNVLITPIVYKNDVIGVIEIGSLENFNDSHKKLLSNASGAIGSAIEVFVRNEELKKSFAEISHKNNILQVQEEELRQSNEELNRQTMLLQQSEEELRNQAAELVQTNAYLEDKGRELENKNNEINIKNDELVKAQEELNAKAKEIEQGSKYKSEFLANMSHELRTPLNSILILSDLLKENNAGNLSDAQIDNLSVINSSGKDLLNLITDILDISKIEAGKVEVYPEESIVERVYSDMEALFKAQMVKKNIEFSSTISDDCPKQLNTDIGKLEQILKNFLSNALKFTPENGKVSLQFSSGKDKNDFASPTLSKLNSNEILSIHIKDNGIGISEENKKKLFQSFQQADSSTSRKYGGTGLGLYISKELAILLGGEVGFESKLNEGSTFSVYIPAIFKADESAPSASIKETVEKVQVKTEETPITSEVTTDLSEHLSDDRSLVTIDDKTILIIEDDEAFAEILFQVAHDNGFKAIVAYQGETGFQYAKKYKPKAIILDMKLPGIDGWTVLKWLKEDKELQHIPVHVMSGMNREKLAKEMGAFDFMIKPITTEKLKGAFAAIDIQINKIFKKVLILEDDVNLNYSLKELVHNSDRNVICFQAHTFQEAEMILQNEEIDCAIMDIGLPDSKNIEDISILKRISKNKDINIIVNTGKSLTEEEELVLQDSADKIVIKTNNATERLKDELVLFLDKVETLSDKEYKQMPNLLGGEILKDKNILIVDDDIRNIYALSSALTMKGASILTAFNGIEALEMLEKNSNIDIVLMDIMMPEMDGFEATRRIRENAKWKNMPIIALTAKAMKSDREEILNAGASDYQSKPIDIQQLISLISIWIYK